MAAARAAPGSQEEALLNAAENGDTYEVLRLLVAGVSVNVTDARRLQFGRTPLHLAAERGHADTAEQLVAAGASLQAEDKWRSTPLHYAASGGHSDCTQQLVAAGACIDAKDEDSSTPLYLAAHAGNADCAQLLVAARASLDAKQYTASDTPLHAAARWGHAACTQLLIAARASLTARSEPEYQHTPLHVAAHAGNADCAQLLVAARASLEATNERDDTAADLAAWMGHKDLAQKLRAARASLGATDQGETTAPRRHLMFSGRFDRSDAEKLIRDTHEQMKRRHPSIPTYIVEASAGKAFGRQTMKGCVGMSAMVAFCGSNYGEDTGSTYSTHLELKYAYEHKVPIIPIKLCQEWPPKGGNEAGYEQNHFVFAPDLVYLDLYGKSQDPAAVADHLAKAYYKLSA